MERNGAALFAGAEDTMIRACVSGTMGKIYTNRAADPTAAQAVLGDFCFFVGEPSIAFAKTAAAEIITPMTKTWSRAIEAAWGAGVRRGERYALKKEPNVFDKAKLLRMADSAEPGYTFCMFDEHLAEIALEQPWSQDFLSLFENTKDYMKRGLGIAALFRGELVAGASSYAVFPGGIEVEIDTRPDHRRHGLATACAARLILACLSRGLYPSWDAANLTSLRLAERLGYRFDRCYPVYFKQ